MEKITNRVINITPHPGDGFTLSYLSDNNGYFRKQYIGYSVREAKRRFKDYVNQEAKNV
jgi:hypothetical protein